MNPGKIERGKERAKQLAYTGFVSRIPDNLIKLNLVLKVRSVIRNSFVAYRKFSLKIRDFSIAATRFRMN